jgi:hypothetical protein
MECGAQVTYGLILVFLASVNLEVRLPPKIFVVKRVILVEEDQVIGQGFHVFEFGGVDERMWRCQFFVVVVKAENDRKDRPPHIFKKPNTMKLKSR